MVAVIPLALAVMAISAPLFASAPWVSFGIRKFFSVVCHQDPARSFWIAGGPVAVCVRCLGIYLGAALGAVGVVRASRARWVQVFWAVVALNVADVAAEWAGLHGNLPAMRFVFGLAAGFAAGALVLSSLRDSHLKRVAPSAEALG